MNVRRRLGLCSLILSVYFGAAAFAAEPLEHFTEKECQDALTDQSEASADVRTRAEAIYSWIDFTHPAVRGAITRQASIRLFYDLAFLGFGALIPPTKTNWFTGNVPRKHYAELTHRRWQTGGKDVGLTRMLDERSEAFARMTDADGNWSDRLAFISRLLDQSFAVLLVVSDWARYRGPVSGTLKQSFLFSTERHDVHQVVTLDWPDSFRPGEVELLRRTFEFMRDPAVRREVVKMVIKNMPTLLAEYQNLCTRLRGCDHPTKFWYILQEWKLPVKASILAESLAPPEAPTAQLPPPRSAMSAAQPADSDRIRWDVRLYDRLFPERKVREEPSLLVSWEKVHAIPELLTDGLRLLLRKTAEDPEWQEWSRGLRPTWETIDVFAENLGLRARETSDVSRTFQHAERSYRQLNQWLDFEMAALKEAYSSEDVRGGLTARELWLLQSIESKLPRLKYVVENALESLARRQDLMLANLDKLGTLQTTLAELLETKLVAPASPTPLAERPAFAKLRDQLASFVTSESSTSSDRP